MGFTDRLPFYYIDADGTGDFAAIQAAISAAVDGDEILLENGVFTGDGNRDLDFLGKAVTVRSQSGSPVDCVIDCEGGPAELHRGFHLHQGEGGQSIIADITITNGFVGGGSWPENSGGAIRCDDGASPTISRCVISNCRAVWGGGIYCHFSSMRITGCTLAGNTATGHGSGLVCFNSSTPFLENTIIAFGDAEEAVFSDDGSCPVFSCSDIYGVIGGTWSGCIADQLDTDGNICLDPLFCDLQGGDLTIRDDSPCAPFMPPNTECDLIGALGVGCSWTADIPDDFGPDEDLPEGAPSTWGQIKSLYR